jgi:hypothetical protein
MATACRYLRVRMQGAVTEHPRDTELAPAAWSDSIYNMGEAHGWMTIRIELRCHEAYHYPGLAIEVPPSGRGSPGASDRAYRHLERYVQL